MSTPTRNKHLENVKIMSTPAAVLGHGTGVGVYRLNRSPLNGKCLSPWALKRITQRCRQTDEQRAQIFNTRIMDEAAILSKLKHPNIIGFRGNVQSKDGIEVLALECCNTSLGTILEERFEMEMCALPAAQISRMIADISSALHYLHTEAKLLHGDLKSFNVLVKGDFEICKLCDFGVSLPMNENGIIELNKNPALRYVGTNLWSAPEVIAETDVLDAKADIFSFGLIIYETIALVPPHTANDMNDAEQNVENETPNTTMENSVMSIDDADQTEDSSVLLRMEMLFGTRPALPQALELADEYNEIIELFYCCTNALPEDRPTAKVICDTVQKNAKASK